MLVNLFHQLLVRKLPVQQWDVSLWCLIFRPLQIQRMLQVVILQAVQMEPPTLDR